MWTLTLYVALMFQNFAYTALVELTENNFVKLKNDTQSNTANSKEAEEMTKLQKTSDEIEELVNFIFRNKYYETFDNGDISADRKLHRSRRSAYVSDHGYGSRLQAGSNIAQDVSAIHDIFGKYGVGKRNKNTISEFDNYSTNSFAREVVNKDSGYNSRRADVAINAFLLGTKYARNQKPLETDDFTRSLDDDLNSFEVDNLGTHEKRSTTDYGYGSRIEAGNKLANSLWTKDSLYGTGGPGKRSRWHSSSFKMGDLESEDTYGKRSLTDYGYGSRIEAGNKLANSLWTKDS